MLFEAGSSVAQQDAVLRALWSGNAWLNCGQIQRDRGGVLSFGRLRGVEQALLLVVGLHQGDLLVGAACQLQVAQSLGVDGEDAAGGAVLGGHVADGGAVRERKLADAGAVELYEFANYAKLAQHLGDGEHEVGGGGAFFQLAGELEAHDLRNEHGDRLAEHGSFGFNAADAPAQNAESVDHGGVGVGADEGVGIGAKHAVHLGGEDYAREVLQVDLMADAHARRHSGEVAEGGLSPLEEGVALTIALELQHRVQIVGVVGAVLVHLHGVVDYQLSGLQGVDLLGVAAECLHGVAHGGEVHDGGHAGEVLHEHAGGHVGDLARRLGLGVPLCEEFNVLGGDALAVLVP